MISDFNILVFCFIERKMQFAWVEIRKIGTVILENEKCAKIEISGYQGLILQFIIIMNWFEMGHGVCTLFWYSAARLKLYAYSDLLSKIA